MIAPDPELNISAISGIKCWLMHRGDWTYLHVFWLSWLCMNVRTIWSGKALTLLVSVEMYSPHPPASHIFLSAREAVSLPKRCSYFLSPKIGRYRCYRQGGGGVRGGRVGFFLNIARSLSPPSVAYSVASKELVPLPTNQWSSIRAFQRVLPVLYSKDRREKRRQEWCRKWGRVCSIQDNSHNPTITPGNR